MSTQTMEARAPEAQKAVAKTPERGKTDGPAKPAARKRPPEPGTPAGRKTATAILEVLGGERSPTEAAEALGVSLSRYYAIEMRALAGFFTGCEPKPQGRCVAPEREMARLHRENERLARDLARQQALARASARAAGLSAPPASVKAGQNGRKWKRRRPVARALRVAARLVQKAPEGALMSPLSSSPLGAAVPLSVVSVKA
jgi:hypothetical protein